MRKRLSYLTCLLALAGVLTVCLYGCGGGSGPSHGTVRGVVLDASTRDPIHAAIVTLSSRSANEAGAALPAPGANPSPARGRATYEKETEADGTWVIDHCVPGPYLLTVTKDGYADWSQDLSVVAGEQVVGGSEGIQLTPSGIPAPPPSRLFIVSFRLAAPVNPAYYYFIAIDTNGNPNNGPVPIVANPSAPIPATGVPLIISDTDLPPGFYVQSHQGDFCQYKELQFIGLPPQGGVSQDGLTIAVVMDLDQITTAPQSVELNLMTSDRLLPPPSRFIELNYDALGPTGNSYLIIPIDVGGVYTNSDAIVPEGEGDTTIPALDITDWTVEVRLTP